MNLRRVGIVYRKEIVDALRDRRTLVAMVVAPLLLYPVLMIVVVQALQIQKVRLERQRYRIAVPDRVHANWLAAALAAERAAASASAPAASSPSDADDVPDALRARLFSAQVAAAQFDIQIVRDDPAACLENQKFNAYLRIEPPPVAGEATPPNRRVQVYFDAAEVTSQVSMDALSRVIGRQADRIVEERMNRRGIERAMMSPLQIEPRSLASPQKVGGALLGQIMPFLLVIMTLTGAIYPAIDLTAGERERGTLETLVAAPAPMLDIVAGKFLVIVTITAVITTLNLLSIGATVQFGGLAQALARHSDGGIGTIPLRALPMVLAAMAPLAVLFSGVMLATCSFARTFKEAQNYMMPVMIAVMIPAMIVSYMPGLRLEGPLAVTPVANVVALIRELFLGKHDPIAILLVVGSTSLYAAAMVLLAARLYGQEAVLFTDVASFRTLLMRRFLRPQPYPAPAAALLLVAVIFPLQFYFQSSMLPPDTTPGRVHAVIAAQQILFFALPALAAAWYLRLDLASALSLRAPAPAAALGGLLLGLGLVPLSAQLSRLQLKLFPSLADDASLQALQSLVTSGSLPVVLLVFALLPALCEELLFRGFLLGGLRNSLRPLPLCLAVGLLFALFHVVAAKLLVTALLGAILTFICWRCGSILPAMLAHAANNGLALCAARDERFALAIGLTDAAAAGWVLPAAALCALAGLGLVIASRPSTGSHRSAAAD